VPQSILQRERVVARLGRPLPDAALEDLLFTSKAEIEAQDADSLTLSVTPDRLDLLSEGGLVLYLEGVMGLAGGLPPLRIVAAPEPAPAFEVDRSVGRIRPIIAGFLATAPDDAGLDAGTLAEAIRFQELLHASVGRERRTASLGIYPYDRLQPPFRYAAEPLRRVRFVPLGASEEVEATAFFRDHPMAQRHGPLGRDGERCLTLRDAGGVVLSLPPVLNSRAGGEARVGDRRLLVESTGGRPRPVREALGLLSVVFASRGWTLSPIPVHARGPARSDGASLLAPRPVDLSSRTLRALAGMDWTAAEVEERLARARLGPSARRGGWRVDTPPWRPDLLAAVDVAEDVILAQALRADEGIVPPSRTRGQRRPESRFRRAFASYLLGLGFVAPYTSLLVSEDGVARVPGAAPIRLAYPVSAEFAFVRDRLLLSHLQVLARNTRYGYPQRIGEVGPVVLRAPAAEPGAETRTHAAMVIASESASFAEAGALVDQLLRLVDVGSVREPAELPGTIPGRAARVRVAGEAVAEIGEIHPDVIAALGVPVPIAWAEVDLNALRPLVGGPEAP